MIDVSFFMGSFLWFGFGFVTGAVLIIVWSVRSDPDDDDPPFGRWQ